MRIVTQKRILGTVFLGIPLIWLAVFVVVPIFLSFYLSLTSYNIISSPKWIGLFNYEDLRYDDLFWKSVRNTTYYTAITVPLGMAISLALAIFINRPLRGISVFRTMFYLPVVAPMVAVSLSWMWLYDKNIGFLNYVLGLFNVSPVPWLTSAKWAMKSVIIMSIWKNMGYNMVIFLAGLQGIPVELYEAAQTDGATGWRCLWSITLPLLKPTTLYVLITSIIGSFQVFSQVYVMTEGGPNNSTSTIVHQIYRTAFVHMEMGYASAMAFILFGFLVVLSAINMKLFGDRGIYA